MVQRLVLSLLNPTTYYLECAFHAKRPSHAELIVLVEEVGRVLVDDGGGVEDVAAVHRRQRGADGSGKRRGCAVRGGGGGGN